MSYRYDAFFSYKRDEQSDTWHETVKDKLTYWLKMELGRQDVKVFFDSEDVDTGDRWKEKIEQALLTSKCIICIWSPLYFQSVYCVSEWQTFIKRQKLYDQDLIIPARYHDGDSFPNDAKSQQSADFSDYTSIMAQFWETTRAVEFDTYLKTFAVNIAKKIMTAPPFGEFPLVLVDAQDLPERVDIKRIAGLQD